MFRGRKASIRYKKLAIYEAGARVAFAGFVALVVLGAVAVAQERPLSLEGDDPLGGDAPGESSATYGSSGVAPNSAPNSSPNSVGETDALRRYVRGRAGARLLTFTADKFEETGQHYLSEHFRVHSTLLWTEENRFRGEFLFVVPLRDVDGVATFLQPGVIFWNGDDVGRLRDRRRDFSLGLVRRVRRSGGGYLGGSVFYDYGRYDHRRVGVGIDYQIERRRLSGNLYLPLSGSKRGFLARREHSLRGVDLSLEQGFGDKFSALARGGLWDARGTGSELVGGTKNTFTGDLRYHLNDVVTLRGGYDWSDDFINTTNGYTLGVDFRFPPRGGESGEVVAGFSADPWSPVRREARLLVARAEEAEVVAVPMGLVVVTREEVHRPDPDAGEVTSRVVIPVTLTIGRRTTTTTTTVFYYRLDTTRGTAQPRVDFTLIDVQDKVTGMTVLIPGSLDCVVIPSTTIVDITITLPPSPNEDSKVVGILLTPVDGRTECLADKPPPAGDPGAVVPGAPPAAPVIVYLPLSPTGAGGYGSYVSLRALDADGNLGSSVDNVVRLTPEFPKRKVRVYVSDVATGDTPRWPSAYGSEDITTAEVVFVGDATFGSSYRVELGGDALLRASGPSRYEVDFKDGALFADFTLTMLDATRESVVELRVANKSSVTSTRPSGVGSGGREGVEVRLVPAERVVFGLQGIAGLVGYRPAAVGESGTLRIPVTVSFLPAVATTFTVAVTGGTAVEGTDYIFATKSVTFGPSDSALTKFLTITGVDDTIRERVDETIELEFVSALGGGDGYVRGNVATLLLTDDEPIPSLSIGDVSIGEGAGGATLTITMSSASAEAVAGNFSTLTGTAGVLDYTPLTNGLFSIIAGSLSASVLVPVTSDDIFEGDESFSVRISSRDTAVATVSGDTAVVTITDDEPIPTLSIGDARVGEGVGSVILLIRLSGASSLDVSGTFSSADGTALAGLDYTAQASGSFTITAGQRFALVSVPVTNDGISEGDESFSVTITSDDPSRGALGDSVADVVITDDDGVPSLSIGDLRVGEGSGTATLTITMSGVSGTAVAGTFSTADGTALAASDYTAATATPFTITAGATAADITVAITDDSLVEGDETFTVSITSADTALATLATATATVTIVDNEGIPTLSITDASVGEGVGDATLTVTLSAASSSAVAGTFTTLAGTAGVLDYTAATGTPFTILAGATTASILVAITDDSLVEGTETFRVRIASASAAAAAVLDDVANVSITDNEAVPTLSIGDVGSVGEGAGNATLTITMSSAHQRAVSGRFSTLSGTAGTSDYVAQTGMPFTILAGATTATITVAITEDLIAEGDETFSVAITSDDPGLATLADAVADVTITDNEAVPGLSIGDVGSVGEGSGNVALTIAMSGVSSRVVSGTFSTADGTATAGLDYTPRASVAFTIAAGSRSARVLVPLTDDSIREGDETFSVSITSADTALATLDDATAVVTITDNEAIPTLSIGDVSVGEGAGTATLTITMSGAHARVVSGTYSTFTGTAGVLDYTARTNALFTLLAGATTATVTVAITDDSIAELAESFEVRITSADPALATLADAVAMVTITDNDAIPSMSVGDLIVSENVGSATLTITMSAASSRAVSGTFSTADGTATAGLDYTARTNTAFTVAAEATTMSILVPVINDALREGGDETFSVTITSDDTSLATLATAVATVTITDNEPIPTLSIEGTSVAEGNAEGAVFLKITMSGLQSRDVRGTFFTVGGTATAGSDFSAIRATFLIGAGGLVANVPVTLLDDSVREGDETFSVQITSNNTALATVATSSATVTITDDEPIPTLSMASINVNELDTAAVLTIALSGESAVDISGTYTAFNRTATRGVDFANTRDAPYTIPAGQLTTTASIALIDDAIAEGLEFFVVELYSDDSLLAIPPSTSTRARVNIVDNERPPELSINNLAVTEADRTITLTITLNGPQSRDVTGTYSTANQSATAGSDYTAKNGAFRIPAGQRAISVSFAILDDTVREGDETFRVAIRSDNTALATIFSRGSASVRINDNDPIPSMSIADVRVNEGAGVARLTITLSGLRERATLGDFRTVADGSARHRNDFRGPNPGVTTRFLIPGGSLSVDITVALSPDDSISDGDKTFSVQITTRSASLATIGRGKATVTILDNEPIPSMSIQDVTVREDAGNVRLTITLNRVSGRDILGDFRSIEDGAARHGFNFLGAHPRLTTPFTISGGSLSTDITIGLANDNVREASRTFSVQITSRNARLATIGRGKATVTITDDD